MAKPLRSSLDMCTVLALPPSLREIDDSTSAAPPRSNLPLKAVLRTAAQLPVPVLVAALFASAGGTSQEHRVDDESAAPNLIIILADDLGYGDITPYEAELVKTPNLDRMAAEGIKLRSFYTTSGVCTRRVGNRFSEHEEHEEHEGFRRPGRELEVLGVTSRRLDSRIRVRGPGGRWVARVLGGVRGSGAPRESPEGGQRSRGFPGSVRRSLCRQGWVSQTGS